MACANTFHAAALRDPCGAQMRVTAPEQFSIVFGTNYGGFTARCRRAHAPAWVDRVFNLALNGYYDDSYFPRVVESERLSIIQFGTNGVPSVSNVYNYSTSTSPCAVIEPQPPQMLRDVGGATPLSNTFGTIAMSTSFNEATGTTWNATAELFVNTANNSWLDDKLFMPICTVDDDGMRTIRAFPSFGELADLGGPGPSLGALYGEGNAYVASRAEWARMGKSRAASVVCDDIERLSAHPDATVCGPCVDGRRVPSASVPYSHFSPSTARWHCPAGTVDSCAAPAYPEEDASAKSRLRASKLAQQHAEL